MCQINCKSEQIVTMNFIINKAFKPGRWKERNGKTMEIFVQEIVFLVNVWKLNTNGSADDSK